MLTVKRARVTLTDYGSCIRHVLVVHLQVLIAGMTPVQQLRPRMILPRFFDTRTGSIVIGSYPRRRSDSGQISFRSCRRPIR